MVADFSYVQGAHDVVKVSETDFHACGGKSPIQRWIDGNTSVTLGKEGTQFYFICSFEGHCPPMQLSITIVPIKNSLSCSTSVSHRFLFLPIFMALLLSNHGPS